MIETKITSRFTLQGLVVSAKVKKGWFWETLKSVVVLGHRDESECVRICKSAIDRYLESGVHNDIIYPEVK